MKLSLLKQKDFSIYILGKFISIIGSNMQQFALSLYVYAISGSATIFATMLSVSILPRLLFSPFAGVFGDWFDRKKMIVRLDFLNAVLLVVFAALFITNNGFNIAMIFTLVILLEVTEVFYGAASSAIIPSLVSKEEMPQAQSLRSMAFSLGQLVSPVIGAALYGFFGLFIVLVINGISFFLTGIMEMFIHVPKHHQRPEKFNTKTFVNDFKAGLSVIGNDRFLKAIILIGVVVNFVFAPIFSVGILVLIIDLLSASEFQYGLFQSVIMLAMVIGPILTANYLKKREISKVCFNGLFASSVLIMLMALLFSDFIFMTFNSMMTPFVLLLVMAFILGFMISMVNITVGTMFAQVVPLHLMGRASAVMSLFITIAIPIGQVLFGIMFDALSASYVIMLGAILIFITLIILRKPLMASTKVEVKNTEEGALAYEV